ncbi:MAG: acylneuraminate cytidylyltransferase family protein [Bacteroidales bacterium]|nr:acylneuraminate cytidylyltransferase family protein [Bacteroidales bacterium]
MIPLYIIPARGGSKGIPRKNIKLLGGKPLIAYTIDEARKSPQGYILLSTDDKEIADVARSEGLAVNYMRPAELASDTAGSREVIIDAMDWATKQGIDYDCVVLLQPTSPMRTAEDIERCLSLYGEGVDMVVSVVESDANPYFNLFEEDSAGFLHVSKGDGQYVRRQDAPRVYEYNGAVYVIRPDALRKYPMARLPRKVPYLMPRSRSIDLDTEMDWLIAEKLIQK